MTSFGIAVLGSSAGPQALAGVFDRHQIYCVPDVAALSEQQRATVAAVVVRSGCRLDNDDIMALPALQHVVRPGSGTDNIDTPGLAARGIRLHRNPDASAHAVGEWILAAAIALLRRIPLGHNGLRAGLHLKADCAGPGLVDRHVAIWGGGPVGQAANSALNGSAAVQFAAWPSLDPRLPSTEADHLLAWADVHVLALPLRPSTQGHFGRAFLDQVQRRPVVVCAGRLGTLDLAACIEALDDGRITGLAIDALEVEHVATAQAALSERPLNLLVSPHVGAQRHDVRAELDAWVTRTLVSELRATDG